MVIEGMHYNPDCNCKNCKILHKRNMNPIPNKELPMNQEINKKCKHDWVQDSPYPPIKVWCRKCGLDTTPKDPEKVEERVNFLQVGRITKCGNCHPEMFEHCTTIYKEYPDFKCSCICHDNLIPISPEKETKYGCNGKNPCRHGVNLPKHNIDDCKHFRVCMHNPPDDDTPCKANHPCMNCGEDTNPQVGWEEIFDEKFDCRAFHKTHCPVDIPKLKEFIQSLLDEKEKEVKEGLVKKIEDYREVLHQRWQVRPNPANAMAEDALENLLTLLKDNPEVNK